MQTRQVKPVQAAENSIKKILLLALSASILAGCAGKSPLQPPYFKEIYEASLQKDNAEAEGKSGESSGSSTQSTKSTQAEAVKPLVRVITIPNPLKRETVIAKAEKVDRNAKKQTLAENEKPIELSVEAAAGDVQVIVENMPLYDFANLVFGEILKLNYTISEDVDKGKERITLNMNRKMTGKDFFPFAVDLLRKNNLAVSEESGVIYVRRKDQQTSGGVTTAEVHVGSIPPGLPPQKRITLVVSTSYVPASQLLQVVRQLKLMDTDIKAEAVAGSQALALSGTVAALSRVADLFDQLDRSSFINYDFNLVYFDYINVIDFNKKIREVLSALGVPFAKNTSEVGFMTIPFEKINALLVISPRKEWFDLLVFWKDKLDAVESMGDEMQMFVYHPKNRPAHELVDILKAVSSGASAPATSGPLTSAGTSATQQGAVPKTAPPAPTAGTFSIPVKGGFSAILDKERNAVIVSASPANFKLIRNILVQLDIPPKQILIEATIMEVSLTDNLQYGVEWLIKNRINKGADTYNGILSTLGGMAIGSSGLNYAVSGADFLGKLNAFAKDSQINIISTPHVTTLDGKQASINVGTEVPIVTSESTAADLGTSSSATGSTTSSIMRSIQYRNTGVILQVKPTINSDGMLTIEISQELSEAQVNSASNIDSPMILNRSIKTTLAVKSGETVLLGGLISTNKSKGAQKIPLLGDIPLLGWLFKTESKGDTKTELIVQITPYILNSMGQLDDITKKFKENLSLQ